MKRKRFLISSLAIAALLSATIVKAEDNEVTSSSSEVTMPESSSVSESSTEVIETISSESSTIAETSVSDENVMIKSSDSKTEATASSMNLKEIQNGNYSSISGTWVNGQNNKITITNNDIILESAPKSIDYNEERNEKTAGYLMLSLAYEAYEGAMAVIPAGVTGPEPDRSNMNTDRLLLLAPGMAPQALSQTFYYKISDSSSPTRSAESQLETSSSKDDSTSSSNEKSTKLLDSQPESTSSTDKSSISDKESIKTADSVTSSINLEAIMNQDNSSIVGTWINGRGERLQITDNSIEGMSGGIKRPVLENGFLRGGYSKDGAMFGGSLMIVLPAGVEWKSDTFSDHKDVSDQTKDRILLTQYATQDPNDFYYRASASTSSTVVSSVQEKNDGTLSTEVPVSTSSETETQTVSSSVKITNKMPSEEPISRFKDTVLGKLLPNTGDSRSILTIVGIILVALGVVFSIKQKKSTK